MLVLNNESLDAMLLQNMLSIVIVNKDMCTKLSSSIIVKSLIATAHHKHLYDASKMG